MKLMQILVRIENAIETMVNMAAFETTTGSLAAVAHSSYLRLLLGAVSGFSLFSATSACYAPTRKTTIVDEPVGGSLYGQGDSNE
jgi:hypothetical protein